MPDDTLRIVARVEDQFTGPLGKLKGELKGVGDATARHGEAWRKDWGNARVEVEKFKGVLGGFSPILSGIGAGGFAAALSIGGMASAIRQFSSSTQQLSMLSRETGVAVDRLRAFGALGERFGVSADAMKGAVSSFATTMFDLRRRWGEAYSSLQAMNLGKLAEDLVNAPDMDAALKKAMDGIQKIPDPEVRRRVSRMLFGTDDVARIAGSLGEKMSDALVQVQREIGKLDKDTEKAAADFEKHLGRVGNAIERLKLGTLGPALKAIDRMIESGDQEGIRGNEQAVEKDLTTRRDRAQARADYLRKHGESDPNAQRKIERLTDEVAKLNEQLRLMREGGGAYQPMSFSGTGMGGGGSLIQKAAWGGFGGGGYGGRSGGSAGGFGGGGSGAAAAGAGGGSDDGSSAGQPRGETGDARPWPGGAHVSPRAPVPFRDAFGRGPLGMGGEPRAGGAGAGGGSTPRGDGAGTRGSARMGQMMSWAMDQLRREGVPEQHLRQSAAHLVGQAFMESGLDPNKVHDGGTGYGIYGARDPTPGRGRRTSMLNWLQANGYARNSAEGQMRYMAREAMSGRYQATRRILMGGGSGNVVADTNRITGEFESPAIINHRAGAVQQAHRLGPENVPAGGPEQNGPLSDPAGPLSPSPDGTTGDMAFGDSIAHGLRSADRRLEGNTQPGISSKEVLKRILGTDPSKFKGKRVFLSSGLSNSPGDLESVRRQIAAIKAAGGRPVLMGAGPRPDLNDANGRLRGLAGEAGVDFQDLGQTSDGVHPNNYGRVLGQLRQKGLPQQQQEAGPAPAEGAGKALMKRLYQDAPIRRPGGAATPTASAGGRLDIRLHGFPQGARATADMGGLFKETSITRGRAQMDMDRV